jgi:cytochrome c-type biogenesis protein CcmH/NrfF
VIRNAVAKGMSADEIIAVYVKTYGPNVVAIPNDQGFAMASWIVPYTGIAASFVFLFFIGQRLRRKKGEPAEATPESPAPATGESEAERLLKQELAELD